MTANTNDVLGLGEELRAASVRYWGKPNQRTAFEYGATWGFRKGLEYATLPEQAAVPPGLKDHEVALLVNRLRDIAMNFHDTQQLRERIAAEIRPVAHALAAAPKAELVPATSEVDWAKKMAAIEEQSGGQFLVGVSAGEYPPLQITVPNEEGAASCIVRWQVETPAGWVGSWNREALDYLLGRAPADSVTAPAGGEVAVPRETLRAWRQWCAQSMSHAIEHEISDFLAAPAQAADSAPADADPIRALIAEHAAILDQNESACFELCYHRATGWMAWITDKPLCMPPVVNPDRKVLAQGQGDTADEACRDAARKQGAHP